MAARWRQEDGRALSVRHREEVPCPAVRQRPEEVRGLVVRPRVEVPRKAGVVVGLVGAGHEQIQAGARPVDEIEGAVPAKRDAVPGEDPAQGSSLVAVGRDPSCQRVRGVGWACYPGSGAV